MKYTDIAPVQNLGSPLITEIRHLDNDLPIWVHTLASDLLNLKYSLYVPPLQSGEGAWVFRVLSEDIEGLGALLMALGQKMVLVELIHDACLSHDMVRLTKYCRFEIADNNPTKPLPKSQEK